MRRGSSLFATLLACAIAMGAAPMQSLAAAPSGRASNHRYAAKGNTGALKIRRAATKARNIQRHKRNCRA